MNEPRHTEPQESRPPGRSEQVAERTRHLRSIGVAGALATLGVFAGLAATGQSSSSTTKPSQTTVDAATGAVPQSSQLDSDDDTFDPSAQNGFFDSSGSGSSSGLGVGSSGSGPTVMSGGS